MGSQEYWYEPYDIILLTGAGFTKTYGGYLASEMWAAILNQVEVQKDSKLRAEMLNNLDFESFYYKVQSSTDYTDEQRERLTEAIRKAYEGMDTILRGLNSNMSETAYGVCRSFLRIFAAETRQKGFIFTLNQDLFVERFYSNDDHTRSLGIPGLPTDSNWFRGDHKFAFDKNTSSILPDEARLQKIKNTFWSKGTGQLKYVKLLGSYGWTVAAGSNAMVLGQNKASTIEKEPLLSWYGDLFREVLLWEKRKVLVVIGYSFRDPHINRVIADGIRKGVLQLCIISPQTPESFQNDLCGAHGFNVETKPEADCLWTGICQYWPNKVTDFYDSTISTTLRLQGNALFEGLRELLRAQ
jgi:SIR2-like domain